MNLIKDFTNIQILSVGEHPLDEVADLASNSLDNCPSCGGPMVEEDQPEHDKIYTCMGCGYTEST